MPSVLSDPTVSAVLDRLFADAEVADAPLRAIEDAGSDGDAPATPQPGSDIEAILAISLRPGALVAADDRDKFESVLRLYLDYVRAPGTGYVSVRVPIGDGIELSVRTT